MDSIGDYYEITLNTKTSLIKNNEYKKLNIFAIIKNTNRNYLVDYYEKDLYIKLKINGESIETYKGTLDFSNQDTAVLFDTEYITKNTNQIDNMNIELYFNNTSLDKKLIETTINDNILL